MRLFLVSNRWDGQDTTHAVWANHALEAVELWQAHYETENCPDHIAEIPSRKPKTPQLIGFDQYMKAVY